MGPENMEASADVGFAALASGGPNNCLPSASMSGLSGLRRRN